MSTAAEKSSHTKRAVACAALSLFYIAAAHADERSMPLTVEQSKGVAVASVELPELGTMMSTLPNTDAGIEQYMSPSAADDAASQLRPAYEGTDAATTAAVADGVTTAMALSAGAVEMNPLVATSPVGLLALTGLKIGLVQFSETLPEEEKRTVMKTTSALWGGAAVNNLLVLLAAPPPISIVAGLVTGFALWNQMEEKYEKADQAIALQSGESLTLQEVAAEPGLEEMVGIYVN